MSGSPIRRGIGYTALGIVAFPIVVLLFVPFAVLMLFYSFGQVVEIETRRARQKVVRFVLAESPDRTPDTSKEGSVGPQEVSTPR